MADELGDRRGAATAGIVTGEQVVLAADRSGVEIAELVWLCSDRAGYVISAAYSVDGGRMAMRCAETRARVPRHRGGAD